MAADCGRTAHQPQKRHCRFKSITNENVRNCLHLRGQTRFGRFVNRTVLIFNFQFSMVFNDKPQPESRIRLKIEN
jgi:hypothetical protein